MHLTRHTFKIHRFLNAVAGRSPTLRHGKMWPCWIAAARLRPVQFSFGNAQSQGTGRYGGRVAKFSTAFAEPLRRANLSDGSGTAIGTPSGAACHFGSSLARPNDVNATLAHGDYRA
jgi:hypothetical protein